MRALAAFFALSALVLPAGAGAAPAERPNIVVIMTDDQTLESMRVMSGVRRSLAAEGTTFERAFVSNALCCPSRATLFSGQYSHNHGVIGNVPPDGGYGRLDKRNWLPVWLQKAGYRTVHIGKFLNQYGIRNPTEVPLGWSEWYASVDPSTYFFYGYTLNENGLLYQYGLDRNPIYYSTDYYAERALSIIRRMGDTRTPFFLSLAFLAPHSGGPADPDDPPGLVTPSPAPRHINRFAGERLPPDPAYNEGDLSDKPSFIQALPPINATRAAAIDENYQQRLESLLAVDEAVVRLVDTLRSERELDNTLILFTSDNGFFHGEHRVQLGKVLVYEPSIRVPLIMRGPGVPEGARRRQLVTNADLAPTILEAAGAKPGKPQDGRSLFPLLEDRGARMGPRSADRGRTRRQPARLRRDPHLPLRLRPARERRARALRPRARPVPAHQPAQRPRLRGRAGGAGAAPGAAVGVRRPQLPREAGGTAGRPLLPCARVGHRRRDGDLPQRAPPPPRPRAPVRLAGRRPLAARADSDDRRARRHAGPLAASALPLRAPTGPSTRRV